MKLLIRTFAILLLCTGMITTAQARKSTMYIPPAEKFAQISNQTLTLEKVHEGLIMVGKKSNWRIMQDQPGVMRFRLDVRGKHVAIVDVKYDETQMQLVYVESSNLNYKKNNLGTEKIHPNYNVWIRELIGQILANVGR